MKKIMWIISIMLFYSSPSFGEWEKHLEGPNAFYFIEKDTVRKKDNLIYFNYLMDYFKPQSTDGYLSQINRSVIDCKNNLQRPLRITNYKRSMGRGKITFDYDSQIKMVPILDGTLFFHFKKLLCKDMKYSSSSNKWIKVGGNDGEMIYYLDLNSIKKVDGFVNWWELIDKVKTNEVGIMSFKTYNQGDCKSFSFRILKSFFHKKLMGDGPSVLQNHKSPEWIKPMSETIPENNLKLVCHYITLEN